MIRSKRRVAIPELVWSERVALVTMLDVSIDFIPKGDRSFIRFEKGVLENLVRKSCLKENDKGYYLTKLGKRAARHAAKDVKKYFELEKKKLEEKQVRERVRKEKIEEMKHAREREREKLPEDTDELPLFPKHPVKTHVPKPLDPTRGVFVVTGKDKEAFNQLSKEAKKKDKLIREQ